MQYRQLHASQHTRCCASSPPNTRALQPTRCRFFPNANVAQLSSAHLVVCITRCGLPAVGTRRISRNFSLINSGVTIPTIPLAIHTSQPTLLAKDAGHIPQPRQGKNRAASNYLTRATRVACPQGNQPNNTTRNRQTHTTNTQTHTHTHTHSAWSSPFRGRSSTWGSAGFSSPSS
jgi:hypothetical protein